MWRVGDSILPLTNLSKAVRILFHITLVCNALSLLAETEEAMTDIEDWRGDIPMTPMVRQGNLVVYSAR